ncbi:MAG TPA: ABC transporter permease [Abditibacteriaceae bacterium]|jgi:ribose transport system permease protein
MARASLPASLRRLLPLFGLGVLCLYFALRSPQFLTVENGFNIARQQSIIMLIAFGMTMVIISSGIDLSVGSVAAFSGVAAAWLMLPSEQGGYGLSVVAGILCGIVVGALWGAFNALLIAVFRLPPFIATLGTMGIARGLAYIRSGGVSIDVVDPAIQWLGNGNLLGLPVPLWLIIGAALLIHFVLRHTVVGRAVYAYGGNANAALLAGVDARKTLFFVYIVAGALTGLAAMIEISRLTSAQPNTGQDYPLDAIAAVVIGGGSLLGGEGCIAGTVIGALVIAVLRNGANLLGVDPFLQMVFIGALILAAVALDQWRRASRS